MSEQVQTDNTQQQNNESSQEHVSRDFLVKAGILSPDNSDETQGSGENDDVSQSQQQQKQGTTQPDQPPQTAQPDNQQKKRKVARGYGRVEEIAKAAAVAAVEAVQKSGQAQPQPKPDAKQQPESSQPQADEIEQKLLASLDDEQKRLLQTFEIVEKSKPEKYKGLRQNTLKALAEWERKKQEWAEANPGSDPDAEFDTDGSIMSSLEQKYGLEVDEQDIIDAGIQLKIDPVKQELERTRRELEEAKAILAAERAKEQMEKAKQSASSQILSSIGIDPDKANEVLSRDTLAAEAAKREVEAVTRFVEAAYMSFAGMKHPLTEQVAELCQRYEDALLNMPETERVDSAGRMFIPRSTYLSLPLTEQIQIDNGTHPKYWGLNAELASMLGANIIAERAKTTYQQALERENKMLQEYGIKPKQAMNTTQKPAQAASPKPVAQPKRTPTNSPTSVNPVPGYSPSPQNSEVPQGFMRRFLGQEPIGGGVTYEITKE